MDAFTSARSAFPAHCFLLVFATAQPHMTRHTHARTRSHTHTPFAPHAHNAQIKELKSMEKVGGSCVAACMVVGHRLFVANVGDCEAVLARWQPALEQYQGSSLRKPQSHGYAPHARLTTTL